MEGHAILFPGQGAQYVGMAKDLALRSPLARAIFSKAEEILGFDLLQVCVDGPAEKLNSTAMSQPAIFVSSLAALEEAKSSNPEIVSKCTATAGLSLGEYTALVFADAISYPDGLRLVAERGRAMQESAEARPSTMASILLLDKEKVQELCDTVSLAGPKVTIANHLCPGNLVVSGAVSAVEETEKLAQATGGKTIRLTVAGAFHTQFMEPAQERLRKALENTEIRTPRVPVWSNVTGKKHENPAQIRELLSRQVVEPVLWDQLVQDILGQNIASFYEVGPGKVLAGLLKRINRKASCQGVPA
jgi:[acyl-carrier-protein] S-malonyltransferase